MLFKIKVFLKKQFKDIKIFVSKQIVDITTYGIRELFRKFYLLIKVFSKIPIVIIANLYNLY